MTVPKEKYEYLKYEYDRLRDKYRELEERCNRAEDRADSAEFRIRNELEPKIALEKRAYDNWATSPDR